MRAPRIFTGPASRPFTFTPDAARSLVLLADTEDAWNQTWHVPTASETPTGKEFIELVAKFDTATRELYEILYQYEFDYIFDSTKFKKAFHFQPTSYAEGVHRTAQVYLNRLQ